MPLSMLIGEVCSALGSLAKMTPPAIMEFLPILPIFFFHALKVDQHPLLRAEIASLLEHLQATLGPAVREIKDDLSAKLTSYTSKDPYLKGESMEIDIGIISLCVFFGMFNCVSEKFAKQPELCKRIASHIPALTFSMRRINGLSRFPGPSPEQDYHSGMLMLQYLLAQGVDPNSSYSGVTEWCIILEDLMDEQYLEDDTRLKSFEAFKLLLRHGADFEQQCTVIKRSGPARN
jgi:hypothetical protein